MSGNRKKLATDLTTLYARFVAKQDPDYQTKYLVVNQERESGIRRLRKRGVVTAVDLAQRLPALPKSLKDIGIDLISLFRIKRAVPALLQVLSSSEPDLQCAHTLSWFNSDRRVKRAMLHIAHRELSSNTPNRFWLEAVVEGLKSSDDRRADEMLVTIFERDDLPGWLRGDAADRLGCCTFVSDRRTKLFRRTRDTALRGLESESIYVQFGSMYLIGALSAERRSGERSKDKEFAPALRQLRHIAANDKRLSPGFWWPMSAEAEDIIGCIEFAKWPQPDAAERWLGNKSRGEWRRD